MNLLVIAVLLFTSCKSEYRYKTGQILMPDYVCQDTLIVKDGKGLSEAMKQTTGTDLDIYKILTKYCVVKDAENIK